MTRYSKSNQTIENLKGLIWRVSGDSGEPYSILNVDITPEKETVRNDLSNINVDFENVESFDSEDSYDHLPGLEALDGYEMIGDGDSAFPVLWCAGGGDWELPLVFILYMGANGELRGYIPENGNAYNHDEKAAYGNTDGDPSFGDDDPRYVSDVDKMKADIANHICVQK